MQDVCHVTKNGGASDEEVDTCRIGSCIVALGPNPIEISAQATLLHGHRPWWSESWTGPSHHLRILWSQLLHTFLTQRHLSAHRIDGLPYPLFVVVGQL